MIQVYAGGEIGRTSLKTAGKAAGLNISVEKYETLAFINVDVIDENGLLAADSTAPLFIKIDGPATLAAFGAAKALHRGGYEFSDTTAGEGHALAILKLADEESKTAVTIFGEGIKEETVEL